MSIPFSMLRLVSSVRVLVSAPPFCLTLGHHGTDFSQTLLLCSGTRYKLYSNTGVSEWFHMGQMLTFVQSAVIRKQCFNNSSGHLGSPMQRKEGTFPKHRLGSSSPTGLLLRVCFY